MGIITQTDEEKKVLGFDSTLDFSAKQEESEMVEPKSPGLVETLGASLADETTIGSAVTGNLRMPYWMSTEQADTEFDPTPFMTDKYIGYEDDFLLANDEQEAMDIQKELDRQIEYDDITSASGAKGIATDIAVQFVDPINYIPFLNTIKVAKGATRGKRVMETAWNFSKAGLTATASQEAILQATQRGRSEAESAVAIGSATLLSGFMGAGVGRFIDKMDNVPSPDELTERFTKEFGDQPLDNPAMESVPLGDSSVGAMVFEEVSFDDLKPAKGFGVEEFIAKVPVYRSSGTTFDPFTNPLMRLMYNSQSKEAKLGTMKLSEFPLRLEGHENGNFVSPPNAMSAIRRDQSDMTLPAIQDLDIGFNGYKKRIKQSGAEPLSRKDFNSEIWMAMNKGDESSLPEVKAVAQSIRKHVLAPALDELRAMGRDLPDAPGKAESYVMRNYSANAIRSDEAGFIDILAEQFARDVAKAEEIVSSGKLKAEPKKTQTRLKEQVKLSVDDFREIAREVSTKIQGLPANRHVSALEFDLSSVAKTAGSASSLKKRSLQLDDDIVERLVNGGFIDTDVELAVKKYMGTVMRDVRISQHIGDVDGTKIMKQINDDYDQKLILNQGKQARATEGTKEFKKLKKEEKKLRKQRDADLGDFKGMVDRVNGTYNANQTSFESVAKNLNSMRLMGSMLESALPDVSRVGLTQASAPIFRQSVGKLKNIITNPEKYRMYVKQAQALTVATDRVLGGRMAHLADIADDMYKDQGRGVTSAVSDYTGKFFDHIGANHWNETWETITATALSSEAMDGAGRFVSGKATAEDMVKFAEGGMDKSQIRTVHKFFKAHGDKDGALSILNIDKWVPETIEEKRAINSFRDMIARSTETLIIQPGQDTSLWGSKGFGSMIMQFKGFGQASLMRSTFLYGQRIRKNPLDYRNYLAAASQIAMGASVTTLRLYLGYLAGSTMWEKAQDWSTERWVMEGVDRSGMLGSIMDSYNTIGQPILSATGFPGVQPLTRFQQRNVVDRALGPTAGLLTDSIFGALPTAAKTLTGQKPTQAEIKATRRILPYQNYIGLRYLLDGGMNKAFDEFNIPKNKKQTEILSNPNL